MAPDSADFIHTVVEASKLAFADKTAYYGDPDYVDVPIETLLSDAYNDARRKLIDGRVASAVLVPGVVAGGDVDGAGDGSDRLAPSVKERYAEATAAARLERLERENAALKEQLAAAKTALSGGVTAAGAAAGSGGGGARAASSAQPRRRQVLEHPWFDPADSMSDTEWLPTTKRDTVHLCVSDRHGNMVSATPSGGCKLKTANFCTAERSMLTFAVKVGTGRLGF